LLLLISEFGFGFSVLVYNIVQLTMRQRVCPPRLLGRMNASIRFAVWGVMPLSALASGYLGEHLGLVTTMLIGAAGSSWPPPRSCSRRCERCVLFRTRCCIRR
jgi:hypothetical protein